MRSEIALDSRVSVTGDVVCRDLEGEAVLLNLRTGVYFSLDPIGTRIWHLLEGRPRLREVLAALVTEYEVTDARGAADLVRLVAEMEKRGLVDVAAREAP